MNIGQTFQWIRENLPQKFHTLDYIKSHLAWLNRAISSVIQSNYVIRALFYAQVHHDNN